MANKYADLVTTVENASKELSQLEQSKQNIVAEVKGLIKEKQELVAKVKEFKALADEEAKKVEGAKRSLEKRIEDQNSTVSKALSEQKAQMALINKRGSDLEAKEASIKALKVELENLVREYENTILAKSEKFKKLLAELKS